MATFALIHGGGGSAWDWHLVVPALRKQGHDAVAVDLPSEHETAGWEEYADAVVQAIGAAAESWSWATRSAGLRRRSCAFAFPSISSSSWRR